MKIKSIHRQGITALFLLAVISCNRLIGLFRSLLLARIWGTGEEAAAFELANSLSATLFDATVGALLAVTFVPAYLSRRKAKGKEEADAFAAGVFPLLLACTLLLFLPFLLFPQSVLSLTAKNLSANTLHSAASSLRFLSCARVLLALSSLLTGILQSDQKPLFPAFLYAAASFFGIPLILLYKDTLTSGMLSFYLLLSDLAVFLLLFRAVIKRHRPTRLTACFPKKPLSFFKNAIGVAVFSSYLPLAALLTSFFCTRIGGEIALVSNGYAIKWVLLSASLLSSAFHAVYYPRIAKDPVKSRQLAKQPALFLFLLSLLAACVLFFTARPLLVLFYQGNNLTANAITDITKFLRLYALSLPLLSLSSILHDTAYLRGKTASLAFCSIAALGLDLVLLFLLPTRLGIYAVPVAFLLASLFRTGVGLVLAFGKNARKEDKVRLLLVLSDQNIGGAGRQLLGYLSHCDREHFQITVALPQNAALASPITQMGIPVVYCGKEASLSFTSLFSYYRLIRRHRPHILHANASLTARIAALFAAVPIRIYTRHCVYPVSPLFRHALPRLAVGCATSLLSTSVIAVAEEAANNLYGMGIPPKKVTVIENGVDPIRRDPASGRELRNRYRIADSETLAVICGRLEPDKGVRTLIEAASLLKQEEQPVTVLIVGKGSEEEALKELTVTLDIADKVHFCGFVSDVSPYLNAADVYVNCSIGTEATSLAIAEAMSLSLPIVATDYGGNPAMVKDGTNGILVLQNDPRNLADALTVMTDEALRLRFGKASHELYTSHYSADRMARRNEALYRNLFFKKGYTLL